MLKLKLQYFGHLMGRTDLLEKTGMLRKTGGRKKRGQQRMRWLDGIPDSIDVNFSRLLEIMRDRGAWWAAVYGVTQSWTRLKQLSSSSSSQSIGASASASVLSVNIHG